MLLRPCALSDAAFLMEISGPTLISQHDWLIRELARPDITMFIAVEGGRNVGWAQIDAGNSGEELRWVIAPKERKKGYGTHLARLLLARTTKSFATIHPDNVASKRIAGKIGLVAAGELDHRGYLVFRRIPE